MLFLRRLVSFIAARDSVPHFAVRPSSSAIA